MDDEEINAKAADLSNIEKTFIEDKRFKLVTVGRFVEQKGFDIAIGACKTLKQKGLNIAWYAVGYGNEEDAMRDVIAQNALENEFIILGRKDNPYPYMANADLYVQPSRHEGYPITLCEAKALKKLIVCTNFAGADEQIVNGQNGVIVAEINVESVADAVAQLYENKEYRNRLQVQIEAETTENDWKKIEKIFKEE